MTAPSSDPNDASARRRSDRIDLSSGADVEHWTKTLGVSAEQLHAIVAITGDRAKDVEDYVRTQGRPTTPE
jgi:ribosomal protein S12